MFRVQSHVHEKLDCKRHEVAICHVLLNVTDRSMDVRTMMSDDYEYVASRSGRVVSASACGVRGPRLNLTADGCLSRQLLRYAALGTGCTLL